MSRADAIARAVEAAVGTSPSPDAMRAVGGGCINHAATLEVGGERVFVKWNDRPLPRQFEAEAAGLESLASAGSGLRVPRVLAVSDAPGESFLLLEYLESGRPRAGFDAALGEGLAALHRATSERGYGFALDGYCGATPQPNPWTTSWVEFFATHRLGHQLRLARENGLSTGDVVVIERLIGRLPALLDDGCPPALIHGDLWSGNLLVTASGAPALIDPAAYFGHREAELSMMKLFGGFSSTVYAAYHAAWPLAPGWEERLDVYALYHVLNHFNLFGGGYARQAVGIARGYL